MLSTLFYHLGGPESQVVALIGIGTSMTTSCVNVLNSWQEGVLFLLICLSWLFLVAPESILDASEIRNFLAERSSGVKWRQSGFFKQFTIQKNSAVHNFASSLAEKK